MIRVLIADDHPIVRRGLRQIICEDPSVAQVDEAGNGHEVLELVRAGRCDVLVMDISMPGMSGIDVLKQLRSEGNAVPVLILSVYPPEQYAVRVLRAGAAGYLTKEAAPEELLTAIQKIASGQRYISPALGETLARSIGPDADQPKHSLLSDREFAVLCRIGAGKTVQEIADELSLSSKTVHTYRSRILSKMDMKTGAELVRYVVEHDLNVER
jgi:DNA-binding NarL/FixJ family response regulator